MTADVPIRVPPFREWVDELKRMLEQLMVGIRPPDRALTPVLFLVDGDSGMTMTTIATGFFTPGDADAREALLRLVVSFVESNEAQRVAWALDAIVEDAGAEREAVMVIAMDREVHEVWSATVARRMGLPPVVGEWEAWAKNEATGSLVTPVQEALRR